MRKMLFVVMMLSVLMLACGGSGPTPREQVAPDAPASEEQAVADIDQQMAELEGEAANTTELDAMAAELDLSDI